MKENNKNNKEGEMKLALYYDDCDDDFDYETYSHEYEEPTIEETENKIEELKKKSKKLKFKKGLYTLQTFGVLCGGLILIPTITSLVYGHFGHSPFKKEDVVRPAYIKTEFDSDGKKEVSKQYEPYEDMSSKVTYYSDWTDIGDKYAVITETYDVSGYTFEEVDGIMKIKGHPSSEPVEEIAFSESNPEKEGNYYVGVVYEKDPKDYILTPQTAEENSDDIANGLATPIVLGTLCGLPAVAYLKIGSNTPLDKLYMCKYADKKTSKEIEESKKLVLRLKNKKKVS